jgi:hypothetical protein
VFSICQFSGNHLINQFVIVFICTVSIIVFNSISVYEEISMLLSLVNQFVGMWLMRLVLDCMHLVQSDTWVIQKS